MIWLMPPPAFPCGQSDPRSIFVIGPATPWRTEILSAFHEQLRAGSSDHDAEPSGQLGNQLLKLGLGPRSGGAASHVPQRAERERKLGDVVPIGGIDDEQEITVAGSQIDLLDVDSDFLGELPGGLAAFGSILHGADALVGP